MACGGKKAGLVGVRKLQLAGLFLHFVEQSGILDGDHGLVGEGLHHCDLGRREWSRGAALKRKGTYWSISTEEWHRKLTAKAKLLGQGRQIRPNGRSFNVGHVNHLCLHNGSSHETRRVDGPRIVLAYCRPGFGCVRNVFNKVQLAVLDPQDPTLICAAKTNCTLYDCAEYGPYIGLGAADDTQDFGGRGLAPTRLDQLGLELLDLTIAGALYTGGRLAGPHSVAQSLE